MRQWLATVVVVGITTVAVIGQASDPLSSLLTEHQFDLTTTGRAFLTREASQTAFVLIGGLHGDNETQALLAPLLEGLGTGEKLVVTELSPWVARGIASAIPSTSGIRLRGIDVETGQLPQMIRALAMANPTNTTLQEMRQMVVDGYQRAEASGLLTAMRNVGEVKNEMVGAVFLTSLLLRSLEVEMDRANPATADLSASLRRERALKDFFLEEYRQSGTPPLKVAAVFGRNHMHRGIDRRGVATVGNFIAELAVVEGKGVFNVALVSGGGRVNVGGMQNADERQSDPAFAYLASVARYPATVFDLRPLREGLRNGNPSLSEVEKSLLYWADSYDAVVYHREVTPMGGR